MITTGLAKLGTGLAVWGLGLPLRMTAFAAVAWGEWRLALLGREWIRTVAAPAAGIQDGPGAADVLTILVAICLAILALVVFNVGIEGRQSSTGTRPRLARKAWRLRDFLRHAPFACWRIATHGGVPVWAILVLPVILAVDLFLVVEVLLVMLVRGLWLAITFRFPDELSAPSTFGQGNPEKEENRTSRPRSSTSNSTKRWIIWILGLALIATATAIPLGWPVACGVLGAILCVWAAYWYAADD